MFQHTIEVLSDSGDETRVFIVQSESPLDERLLQIAGMVLDGGISPSTIRHELATAQTYAMVSGDERLRQDWVDEVIAGKDE